MKKHTYLDLNIGDIEEYAMVIHKNQLKEYKKAGWLTFKEVNLPEGDEHAAMLYGEIKENEILVFNKPTFLREYSIGSLKGIEVEGFSANLGTYGMGGPGFFGLLLSNALYITYAVWGAGDYVIIDNRVLECLPNFYTKTKPWVSNYGGDNDWDDLTHHIKGSKIVDIVLENDSCKIVLRKSNKTIEILFVKNDIRLPRKVGRKRNAYKKGNISDYIIFQHQNATLIV